MSIKNCSNILLKGLLLGVALLFLVSCAKKTATSGDETFIALSMPGFDAISVQWIVTGARKYVADNPDKKIKLTVLDAQANVQKQISQAESMLLQSPKVFAYFPGDSASARPILNMYKDAKIPVVTINALPEAELQALAASFIGSDDVEAGRLQMQMLKKDMGDKANIAVIEGSHGAQANLLRLEGHALEMKDMPNYKIVAQQEDLKWSTEIALKITENWIQSGLEFDAVIGICDTIAMGSVLAGENAKKPLKVYGVDALPIALEAVKAGRLNGTVWQDMLQQGYKGMEVAYKVAMGEQVPPKVMIPFEAVTKDNVDSFIQRAKERDELHAKYFK